MAKHYTDLAAEAQARAPSDLPPRKGAEPVVGGKETSPELAKLAGRYVNATPEWFKCDIAPGVAEEHCANVRRLAASVLSQTEPKP